MGNAAQGLSVDDGSSSYPRAGYRISSFRHEAASLLIAEITPLRAHKKISRIGKRFGQGNKAVAGCADELGIIARVCACTRNRVLVNIEPDVKLDLIHDYPRRSVKVVRLSTGRPCCVSLTAIMS
jgi:hypothetical protein